MAVELVPAGAEHMSLLRSLLQFYEYDWSEISGRGAVDEEGRFLAMDPEEFLADAGARAFVIRVGAEPAGFVFVKPYSFFAQTGVMAVSEFFVMRRYRRAGVGAAAATRVFDMFPGGWEVSETMENTGAHAFWRTVIGRYTGGDYEEVTLDDERWHGPVQRFTSPGRLRACG